MLSLTVEKRPLGAKSANADTLRKTGKMPAVFYGPKEKSTPVVVSHVDFLKVWKKAGESSVIILKEGSDEHEALIHDIDFDPITDVPRHADFYVIEKGKKVKVAVHLSFDGVAPAVKDLGGILIKVLHEIKIEAAPKDLPHELHADVSALTELSSTIHAGDIKLPAGVTLVTDKDEVVASIAQAKEEPVEAPTAVDMTQIEVEKKGKEAKEGEGEAVAGDAGAKDAKDAGAKDSKKEAKK